MGICHSSHYNNYYLINTSEKYYYTKINSIQTLNRIIECKNRLIKLMKNEIKTKPTSTFEISKIESKCIKLQFEDLILNYRLRIIQKTRRYPPTNEIERASLIWMFEYGISSFLSGQKHNIFRIRSQKSLDLLLCILKYNLSEEIYKKIIFTKVDCFNIISEYILIVPCSNTRIQRSVSKFVQNVLFETEIKIFPDVINSEENIYYDTILRLCFNNNAKRQ